MIIWLSDSSSTLALPCTSSLHLPSLEEVPPHPLLACWLPEGGEVCRLLCDFLILLLSDSLLSFPTYFSWHGFGGWIGWGKSRNSNSSNFVWYWQPFYQFCFKVCLVQVCYSVCLLALAIALSPLQRWVRSTPLRSSSLAGLLWLPSAHSPRAWLLDHWTARLWIAWYSCKIPVSACIMQSEHCFDKSWATHQLIERF